MPQAAKKAHSFAALRKSQKCEFQCEKTNSVLQSHAKGTSATKQQGVPFKWVEAASNVYQHAVEAFGENKLALHTEKCTDSEIQTYHRQIALGTSGGSEIFCLQISSPRE